MKGDAFFEISFFESLLKRSPRYVEVISILGNLYTRNGRINDGLRMDRKLVRLQPENPAAHYNLACSLALKMRKRDAVAALRKSLECGYKDYEWIKRDSDLDNLRAYQPFRELLSQYATKFKSA